MPLRDPSTWSKEKERYETNPSKNAHDKANETAPNPTDYFPGYDSSKDLMKHYDKDIDY